MKQGRVRAGVAGFHPWLQMDLISGEVHNLPDEMWSDALFEPVESIDEITIRLESIDQASKDTPEPPPIWRRSRPVTDAVKED